MLTGKTSKLSPREKERRRLEIDSQRDQEEELLKGGYRLIYPSSDKT
jgi:hypothetical protein